MVSLEQRYLYIVVSLKVLSWSLSLCPLYCPSGLHLQLSHLNHRFCADDSQLLNCALNHPHSSEKSHPTVFQYQNWMMQNKLLLSSEKSEAMRIETRQKLLHLHQHRPLKTLACLLHYRHYFHDKCVIPQYPSLAQ